MLKSIYLLIYFWLYMIWTLRLRSKLKRLGKQGRIAERDKLVHKEANSWSRGLANSVGVKVSVTGAENVPKDGGVLFVANHQSYFDIPILIGYIDKPKAFIGKVELMKIPILGTWMKYLGCVFIDRNDVRQSLKAINQGADLLKSGHSIVVFPEGTRSIDGNIGEFKPGSLKLAIKSGVPIVPVTIKGSINILSKKKFMVKSGDVEIIISAPILMSEFQDKDSNKIAERVREVIVGNFV